MGWTEIGEVIKAVAPVFTAGAACAGAVIGWRGLEKWRSESLAKRQAEVAETTLASVYEMEEILRHARSTFILPNEVAKKYGVPEGSHFGPEAILREYDDFFGQFRAQKFVFAAMFGREAAQPLQELWEIRRHISSAVDYLVRNKEKMESGDEVIRRNWGDIYSAAFRSNPEADDLGKRILDQVSAVEATCRPAIEARASQ